MPRQAKKDKEPRLFGAHVSASGGVSSAWANGADIGATCMQIFTANQMQWHPKPISDDEAEKFRALRPASAIRSVMSHDSYLINLCATDDGLHKQSIKAFGAEIERCARLGVELLNFHPGSHKEKGAEWGIKTIAAALDSVRPLYKGKGITLVLETTAGQGSSVGWRFDEIAEIIRLMKDSSDVGVCVDTCHIFVAGYDIRTAAAWEKTWNEFDRIVGLKRLKGFHVNDSKKGLGSRVDRHAELGKGEIGAEAFRLLVNDERFAHLPMNLETPGGTDGFRREIEMLRGLVGRKKI